MVWLFWLFFSLVCVVLYLIPVGIVWERLKPRPILLPPPIDYHKRICGFSGCRPCYDHTYADTYADKNCAVCWENDFTRCTVEFAVLSECLKQYRSDNDQHVDTRVAMAIFWFVMLPIWVGQFLGKPKKKVVTEPIDVDRLAALEKLVLQSGSSPITYTTEESY